MIERNAVVCMFLIYVIAITGCMSQTDDQSNIEQLTNGSWLLVDADENAIFSSLIPGTEITISFQPDGSYSGSSGCNSYSGRWSVKGDDIEFSRINLTKQMCEPASVMDTEKHYIRLLQETATYLVNEGNLTLTGDSATSLIFKREM
jgi:heat shock protein HslJ